MGYWIIMIIETHFQEISNWAGAYSASLEVIGIVTY